MNHVFLDLDLSIANDRVSSKCNDKRENFNLKQFIPHGLMKMFLTSPSYGVLMF